MSGTGVETLKLKGDPEVSVTVRRSGRARRLSLRVSGLDGRVTLTLPTVLPLREAQSFLAEKEAWLRAALVRAPDREDVDFGSEIILEGRSLIVTPGAERRIRIKDDQLLVPKDRLPGPQLAAFCRQLALVRLTASAERYAALLGREVARISLRDTRSRWGSCSSTGRLMFSWRLIMAPPHVLDYVAAHEAAHLVHMHHGPAFWQAVEDVFPSWRHSRDWLRRHGTDLHRYRFGD